jgi:hypothetical protein
LVRLEIVSLKYSLGVWFPELPGRLRFNVARGRFWEDYSSLPWFHKLARLAMHQSKGLAKLVRDKRLYDKMARGGLWRFFEMAAFLEAGTSEGTAAWLGDLRRKEVLARRVVYPWFQRVGHAVRSVLGRLR